VSSPGWEKILASMSPGGQRGFAADSRKGVIALAGRGAGKSFATAAKFHRPSYSHPNCTSVFITMSSERARDIMMPAIWELNKRFGTQIEYRAGDNCCVWPNGYKLMFRGLKDINESNKRRGTPFVCAAWDECASINSKLLEHDIHEVIEPRLVDYDGRWWACGTPGPLQTGYWYQLSGAENPNFPTYRWTALENKYMPNVLQFYSEVLRRMGGIPDPKLWPSTAKSVLDLITDKRCWKLLPNTFLREYLGQWVTDLRALIYRLSPRNSFSEFPIQPDYWTIGLDLGAHSEEEPDLDHAALSVVGSHSSLPYIWVRESTKLSDVTVDSLAATLLERLAKYPDAAVHIDGTSAGKLIERTLQRMGIPIQCADKAKKLRRIQLVQSAIRSGNLQLHVRDCMDARAEATTLQWNEKRDDHSPRCSDDAWDAILYGVTPHMGEHEPIKPEPVPGTVEFEQMKDVAEFEAALQDAMGEDPDGAWDWSPSEIWIPGNDLWLPLAA
jgi:hypothetical protein